MGTIADILKLKGPEVFIIAPGDTVFAAVQSMVEHNVGALIVQQGEAVEGIVTERDYLRQIVVKGRSSRDTEVREIMSSKVVCIAPSTALEESMAIMSERRFRHLPVMDGGQLVGVVSVGDLVKQLSRDQQTEIHYLNDFISGRYPG